MEDKTEAQRGGDFSKAIQLGSGLTKINIQLSRASKCSSFLCLLEGMRVEGPMTENSQTLWIGTNVQLRSWKYKQMHEQMGVMKKQRDIVEYKM